MIAKNIAIDGPIELSAKYPSAPKPRPPTMSGLAPNRVRAEPTNGALMALHIVRTVIPADMDVLSQPNSA
ncbi:hypothetical protein ASE04_12350 [Rhizobium sp. Root708]|nr:hypothetical protein ASE04_12350 [Rhizobium sp. Root708]